MKKSLFLIVVGVIILSGCTSINKTMREPNARVEFTKNDFVFSGQVTGEARTLKIFKIDWSRLFRKEKGHVTKSENIAGIRIPVIGALVTDYTQNYALYNMLSENSEYDVVFYPRFKTTKRKPVLGIGFFATITVVQATARLAKIKD